MLKACHKKISFSREILVVELANTFSVKLIKFELAAWQTKIRQASGRAQIDLVFGVIPPESCAPLVGIWGFGCQSGGF